MWDFVKNYENSSISPKLGFCEKPLKLIDLAESRNFSCKLPCFRILKFSEKVAKREGFYGKPSILIDLAETTIL